MNEDLNNYPRPRRRLWIILGSIALALLAVGWSYGWMRAQDFVGARFDAWLAAEADSGRAHECNNRHIGGYPLAVSIYCETPVLQLGNRNGEEVARFSSLKLRVPAYAPYRLVADFGAPFNLEQNGKPVMSTVFSRARASLRHDGRHFQRLDLKGADIAVNFPEGRNITAKHSALRIEPVLQNGNLHYLELTAEAKDMLTPGSKTELPMDVVLSSTVHSWPGWRGTPQSTLDDWRRSEGKIEIKGLRIKRNGGQFFMTGEAALNEVQRVDGRFEAAFVNGPALLRGLIMQGDNDAGAMFGPLLLMLGKQTEFEGQRATSIQLKVNNGVLTFGNMVLGEFPPLY